MLSEALVIFACINSTGCQETSTHYYNTHPDFRELIEKDEKKLEKLIGPMVITTVGPIIYAAAGGTGTIQLNKYFSLQLSIKQNSLIFGREF